MLVEVNMHRIKDLMELVSVDSTLYVLGDRDIYREARKPWEGQFYYLKNF